MLSQTQPSTLPSSQVVFSEGAVHRVPEILDDLGAENVLLVIDEAAYVGSGAAASLANAMAQRSVQSFQGFQLNPKLEDVERGVELFRRVQPQAILAIGGGSALDIAKLISACSVQEVAAADLITGRYTIQRAGPPLIAVPTTAGTGSEATHFAVAYVAGKKYSLAHRSLLPAFVVLDPALTFSLPPKVTATSGLDALCQAVESTWAVGATDESMNYAVEAMSLVAANLEPAVNCPTPAARTAMMQGAHLAGKAINITKTTAPHAISYTITSDFRVPHGSAVALTLAAFLRYNGQVDDATCCDRRGAEAVRLRIAKIIRTLGATNIDEACQKFTTLVAAVHCPTRLGEVGISARDIEHLITEANVERFANNPRLIDRETLRGLLTALL